MNVEPGADCLRRRFVTFIIAMLCKELERFVDCAFDGCAIKIALVPKVVVDHRAIYAGGLTNVSNADRSKVTVGE